MVRIYSFNTYKLLNYRVYCDLGIVIYKNFLAMGTSFNIGEPLTAYSSLIIFKPPPYSPIFNYSINLVIKRKNPNK